MANHDLDPHIQAPKQTMEKALEAIDQRLVIPLRHLHFRDPISLGCGSFGLVRKATLDTDSESKIVAVKQLHTSGDGEDRIFQGIAFVRELRVWTRVDHPHIVRLLGFHWDSTTDTALFISSYEPMGSLFRYLKNAQPSPDKRLELASDTADGLTYLHECIPPICHGDLTSRNVVITADFRAKLCDFGLSKVIEETASGLTTDTFNAKGAARYRSPELDLPGARRNLKSDIWAWSCVASEIIADTVPYHELKDYQVTPERTGGRPPVTLCDLDIEPAIKGILSRCWVTSPDDRPEIRSCFNDLTRERLRLQARASIPETTPSAFQVKIDVVLESLSKLRIDENWFQITGAAGTSRADVNVYLARVSQPFTAFAAGDEVIVERWWYKTLAHEQALEKAWEILQRIDLWSAWDHPNIVTLNAICVTEDSPFPYPITASAAHGNLKSYLERETPNQLDRIRLAIGTAKGVAYLHTRKPPICHGDLNGHHVVVDSSRCAKLCGFSLASTDGSSEEELRSTVRFAAPERLASGLCRLESDVWAWALL